MSRTRRAARCWCRCGGRRNWALPDRFYLLAGSLVLRHDLGYRRHGSSRCCHIGRRRIFPALLTGLVVVPDGPFQLRGNQPPVAVTEQQSRMDVTLAAGKMALMSGIVRGKLLGPAAINGHRSSPKL